MAVGDPIDYSSYYTSIVSALQTIANNSTDIKNSLATIATQTTTLATQTTTLTTTMGEIEGHQQKLRELGQGDGIHIVGAYDAFGMVTLYRLLIEQAKILDTAEAASPEQIAASIDEVERVVGLIRTNIPTEF
jgi:hypothetical protein